MAPRKEAADPVPLRPAGRGHCSSPLWRVEGSGGRMVLAWSLCMGCLAGKRSTGLETSRDSSLGMQVGF